MILAAMDEMQQGMVLALIVLCAITTTLMMLRRRQFRQVTGRDMVREQKARLRDQKEIRGSMEELLLQLEDVSRRVNAQLDTKFTRLETVVRDADERIARLEGLLGKAREKAPKRSEAAKPTEPNESTSPTKTVEPLKQSPPTPKLEATSTERKSKPQSPVAPDAPSIEAISEPKPKPRKPAAPQERTEEPEAPTPRSPERPIRPRRFADHLPQVDRTKSVRSRDAATPPANPSPAPRPPLKPEHKRVYDLADGGAAPIGIAQTLGLSLGEVELILDLRNYR